ncbi:hypothetical protein WJX84_004282 [Apatococcus fuscideae]|uniref:rRNA-processing protein EFG1 n=1 Tax=Apatococcus fuscideae TaxID=2026836 RepID=A0AAW1SWN6_9CHLO
MKRAPCPPKAVRELTAKLDSLSQEHGKRQLAAREKQMSQRYHKIKFFERRKLERRIRDDLQYVLFFPPAEKYVSVIKDPGELEGEARAKLEAERKRLRGMAWARRAEEAMVNEADEGAGLLGPLPDPLDHDAPEAIAEEQDDFFLQDTASEADSDAPAPMPWLPPSSARLSQRLRRPLMWPAGLLPTHLMTARPMAGASMRPCAIRRPHSTAHVMALCQCPIARGLGPEKGVGMGAPGGSAAEAVADVSNEQEDVVAAGGC